MALSARPLSPRHPRPVSPSPQLSRRRLLTWGAGLTLAIPALSAVSGCSAKDRKPNATLMELRASALQLRQSAQDAGLVGMDVVMAEHGALLEREITRLCGHTKSGDLPESCEDLDAAAQSVAQSAAQSEIQPEADTEANGESGAAPAAGADDIGLQLARYSADLREAFDPQSIDSGVLVGLFASAQQLAAQFNLIPIAEIDDSRDADYANAGAEGMSDDAVEGATAVLSQLYAAIYGLGVAIGHASGSYRSNFISAADKLRDARDAVISAARAGDHELPFPQGAYQFETKPTDDDSSVRLAIELFQAISTACYHAAQQAEVRPVFSLFAAMSASSAIDAAYFRGRIGQPSLVAVPGLITDPIEK